MSDRLLGVSALVFAALMAWFGHDLQAPFSYEPVGPRAFPLLIALIVALCGAWLLFKNWRSTKQAPHIDWPRLLLMVVYVFGYALLFEWLGFIIATAIVTVLIGRLFGGGWGKMIIGGITMSVLFFLLFDRALDVVLPLGLLEFLS
ncbi:tripartite tricarboxylate transporter TctB family protein [Castellaniella defragrans]|uniref:Putative tricarboxylic transport membrane protein n=1 Tax=Castellaniella defragrans TaxID=75697 RepID=A0A7W9TK55_CASDE|nr:tripartite tricarboxylate transporter TctB family protein [Castellaniella defragrans]KAB0610894.1 tripartite tricarboxylate transporter TctB family protein [Castellaniella defragrans]MBB6082209.1 putative tricarboxylic transport membrane protein [Castellaniella defragrans]